MDKSHDKLPEPTGEPLFTAIARSDPAFQAAYDRAAATIPRFIALIEEGAPEASRLAKLRFRDPDESERLGEDRFLFLWLTDVFYYPDERKFTGMFFEIPPEFQKWHQAGQYYLFEPDQIFDWMVLRDGRLNGGFTLRVAREKLPEEKRESYDRYVGVSVYEPIPDSFER